jgi:hypothetical protein
LCHELFYRERIRLRAKSYLNEKQIRKYNYCIKNHVFPDFIVEKNIYEIELHDKGRRTTKKVMRLVNKFPNYKHIWYVRSDTNEGKRIAGNIAAAYKYLDITEAHYEIRKIK